MMRACDLLLWVIVLAVGVSTSLSAEPHATGTAGAAGTNRFGESKILTSTESWAVWKGFATTDEFVRGRWDEKLPLALEAARFDKKEDDVAGIFAKLVGMVDGDQFIAMGQLARDEAGKLEKSDNRYAELLKHMEWTKEILAPTPKEKQGELKFKPEGELADQFERYKKVFLEKWDDQKKKNEEFYALLDKAEGKGPLKTEEEKTKAIEDLRTKYDAKALPAFIANSKKELGDRVADKIGWAGGDGKKFLDVVSNGKAIRINYGAEGGQEALKKFAVAQGGIPVAQLSFSPKRNDKPDLTFTVGQPAVIVTNPPVKKFTRIERKPLNTVEGLAEKTARDALTTSCARCHAPGKPQEAKFSLKNFLEQPSKEALNKIYKRVVNGVDGQGNIGKFMPPVEGGGSDALKKAIRNWAYITQSLTLPN